MFSNRRFSFATTLFLALAACFCLSSSSAGATEMVNTTIPTGGNWLIVARPGSNGMNAPEQSIRSYIRQDINVVDIFIEDACDNASNDDGIGNNSTEYWFSLADNVEDLGGNAALRNFGGSWRVRCNRDRNLNLRVYLSSSGYEITTVNTALFGPLSFKVLRISASVVSTDNYNFYENRFRFVSNSPLVLFGYASVSGNPGNDNSRYTGIAYPKRSRGWGYEVNIAFAQKCSATPQTVNSRVYFFDTDHNSENENLNPEWQTPNNPMRYQIFRYSRGDDTTGSLYRSGTLTGEQGQPDSTPVIQFRSDFGYRIRIYNINYVNTIQIALPFDQIDAYDTCTPPPDPSRCPEQTGFFPTSYWKQATSVQRQLPGNSGIDGGYWATDVYTHELINDQISNPSALSNHGVTLSARGDSISNIESDYQPLVDQLPYDTHLVTGSAQFQYRERYRRLVSVTATWTRTVVAAYTTVDYQWSYSNPGGSWVNTGNCYFADQYWTTSVPKGYSVLASRPVVDGKGNVVGTEYLVGIQTCLYSLTTYHPPVTETQSTTAYTAPPAPPRGAYWNVAWNFVGATASYAPETQTQRTGSVVITFPTLGDCLFRRATNTMITTVVGVAPAFEDPSTVNYTTTMQTTFAPTDPSRTQIRAQNRASPLSYSTNYYIRNAASGATRSLTNYNTGSGSFSPVNGTHSAPLSGTFGFGSINSTSVDSFRVSRGGAGAPAGQAISRDDTFCSTITSSPRVVLIDSSGTIRRVENASGTTATGSCSQPVVDAPHFRIFNGDGVATGMPIINSNEVCGAGNINASVRGSRSGRGAFYGSTIQVAGRAAGTVSIGTSSRFPVVSVDNRLTFPGFRLSGDCMVNYYSRPRVAERANLPMSLNSADYIGTSSYQLAGGATLPSGELRQGARLALYVNGDATITGNITYQNSSVGYSSIESMPHLMIVVNGNLSIAPTVTRVDATIMASGRVLTCSTGTWDGCRGGVSPPLVINGIVTANSIRPFRLIGTASLGAPTETAGSSTLGDAFVISPESILSLPPMPTQGGITNLDSITELPPLF